LSTVWNHPEKRMVFLCSSL